MKKLCLILCFILMISLLLGCGRVLGAERSIVGTNELHTEGDIHRGMNAVQRFFRWHFHGCKLETLIYEENRNVDRGYSSNQMEIISTFTVDESNTDGPLEPGETYKNYSCELERTFLGRWKLVNWGYG